MINVTLGGTGGMMPLPDRFLSSCFIEYNGSAILIDCGEGTQVSLAKGHLSMSKINTILITHCHADHVTGLPGLLLTLGNCSRTEPVRIIGPEGIREVIEGFMRVCKFLPYDLSVEELSDSEPSEFESIGLSITSIPLIHPVSCLGYSLELKLRPRFNPDRAKELNIPVKYWKQLHSGVQVEFDDHVITPDMVLGEPRKPIKISYCTDTRPTEHMADMVRDSDLFICEGMYGDDDQYENAVRKRHMLFSEAANIAKSAAVKEMWLTHFSPSLINPEDYIEPVRRVFPHARAGKDLLSKTLKPSDD